jgi:hypothetical protein
MSVQHEIKSQLAKLLATEDLVVEHKNVETACFNVHTRVLTLPMWEGATNEIYDMLVAHEVGHALYTPDRDWLKEYKMPPQFVNVVEDARIEKLMKRRYPGIPKTFYRGYSELSEQDFFSIEGVDISKMNLADRANLYFKIGNFVEIPFGEDLEMPIIRMIDGCEDFDDVLLAAQALYKYCQSQMNTDTKTDMDSLESQSSGESEAHQDNDSQQQEQPGEGEETLEQPSGSKDEQLEESESQGGGISQAPSVDTMDSLEKSIQDLINKNGIENVYLEIPKVDLKNIIVPNEEIHRICDYQWKESPIEWFDEVDSEFLKFKKSAQKEVNYLVKEFECRKSADSYARATTARTGVLDCTKLHTYKYNEDLFKKVTTLADGKNHGLVFVLDWSGSMADVMMDTVKQLFNLVWFCKKVGIPFDVYAFTNDYPLGSVDEDGQATLRGLPYKKREGLIQVGEWFSLMNMLTHKTNTKTLEHQMKNIFRMAWYFSKYAMYHLPTGMSLSGTPLNETMITLHQLIPQFKKENALQKVQCVVLTDGEGYSIKYHREVQRSWETKPFLGTAHVGYGCFLRDRKTGNTYNMGDNWYEMTDILLRNLRDNFIDTNFIGIRVLESRDANSFIRRYTETEAFDKIRAQWKKERAFTIKTSGYHTYFGLSASALANESEFEVGEDATKTQIKSAFVKSLRNKKMNKKVLNEFVELVA